MNIDNYKKYYTLFVLALIVMVLFKLVDNLGFIWRGFLAFLAILYPIAVAFGISFLIYPLCQKSEVLICQTKISFVVKHRRGIAVATSYIAVAMVIALVFYILIPILAESIVDFAMAIPSLISEVVVFLNKYDLINIDSGKIYEYIEKIIGRTQLVRPEMYTATLFGASKWIVNFVLSLIMSVYILLDRESLLRWAGFAAGIFISDRKRGFIKKYVGKGIFFTYRYFYCSLIDALIIFALSLLLLSILKVPYAPVLSLLLGFFNLVPYFGSVCASIIAVIVTGTVAGISKAAVVGISLLILQQIDGNVIHPYLVKETLSVKPFWVLAGLFIGGGLFGIWGIVLSVPALALLKSVLSDLIGSKVSEKS